MNPPKTEQERAKRVLIVCFTRDELEFLNSEAQFIGVVGKLENMNDALKAVELGERLLREARRAEGQTGAEFSATAVNPS